MRLNLRKCPYFVGLGKNDISLSESKHERGSIICFIRPRNTIKLSEEITLTERTFNLFVFLPDETSIV